MDVRHQFQQTGELGRTVLAAGNSSKTGLPPAPVLPCGGFRSNSSSYSLTPFEKRLFSRRRRASLNLFQFQPFRVRSPFRLAVG